MQKDISFIADLNKKVEAECVAIYHKMKQSLGKDMTEQVERIKTRENLDKFVCTYSRVSSIYFTEDSDGNQDSHCEDYKPEPFWALTQLLNRIAPHRNRKQDGKIYQAVRSAKITEYLYDGEVRYQFDYLPADVLIDLLAERMLDPKSAKPRKIVYREGNLLDAGLKYIAHGCNAQKVMGSGIALEIKNRRPLAYKAYCEMSMQLGTISVADGVINCITQEFAGNDKSIRYCSYDAIAQAIKAINNFIIENNDFDIEVGFPLIGAGLANGDWNVIEKIIESEAKHFQPVVYRFVPPVTK